MEEIAKDRVSLLVWDGITMEFAIVPCQIINIGASPDNLLELVILDRLISFL